MNRIPSYQEYVDFINRQQMGGAMTAQYPGSQFSQQPVAPNILPPQQVVQANGKASISALRMSPNSSVLIMDTTAPMVWLCTSDGLGNVTPVAYDITPHKDTPAPDVSSFEQRLSTVETNVKEIINRWEDMTNAVSKPNAGGSKQKQGNGNGGSAQRYQEQG